MIYKTLNVKVEKQIPRMEEKKNSLYFMPKKVAKKCVIYKVSIVKL